MNALIALAVLTVAVAALTPVALLIMHIGDTIDRRHQAERAATLRRLHATPARGASFAPDLTATPAPVKRATTHANAAHGVWEDAIETTFRSMWDDEA